MSDNQRDKFEAWIDENHKMLVGDTDIAWQAWQAAIASVVPDIDWSYPRDLYGRILQENSPYAFYLLQWVPYQEVKDQITAKKWRLKMLHDVKTFDGREAFGIWPNGSSCGPFKDDEVEFIRISANQHGHEYKDPRGLPC